MVLQCQETTITYFQIETDWDIIKSEIDGILSNIGIGVHSHIQGKGKRKERFITIPCAFDIETTRVERVENKENIRHAYMWIWQFSLDDLNIIGRSWDMATKLFNYVSSKISEYDDNTKLICWVHNLKHECSFMLPRYYRDITKMFCMEKREVVYCDYKDSLRFQDSMLISGCSLDNTAKQYQLPHKKAKGNLDYSLTRNSKTPLTDTELYYCLMDTIVLCDFAKVIYDTLIEKNFGKIPLTKTQMVLNAIYEALGTEKLKAMMKWRPQYDEYLQMSQWLYRGGYVHSNALHSCEILEDLESRDITSSYPSSIAHGKYAVSRFYKRNIKSEKDFYWYLNNRCCWFRVCYTNVRPKTTHSIESKSKIEYYEGAIWDNGRLRSAKTVILQQNEIDFDIWNKFYTYDSMSIDWFKMAYKGDMPKEIVDTMMEWYRTKARIKAIKKDRPLTQDEELSMMLAKSDVNSTYGAFVKKTNIDNWVYLNGQWQLDKNNAKEVYDKQNGKLRKLPYALGIWVTALSRQKLLNVVAEIGDDVQYCDTDSVKASNMDKHQHIFDRINKDIIKHNIRLFGNDPLTNDLGTFDFDGKYKRFMSMRAKCYAYEDAEDGTFHSTISGLKKGVIKSFEEFRDGYSIEKGYSDKVTSHYNDEYHKDIVTDYLGNTEVMEEYGSCCLYEVGFNIAISDDYRDYLNTYFSKRRKM